MNFDESECQRCKAPCFYANTSCYGWWERQLLDASGIDPVLCEECTIIFIMTFAEDQESKLMEFEYCGT